MSWIYKAPKVFFLFIIALGIRVGICCKVAARDNIQNLLLHREEKRESFFPQVFLLLFRDATALLVANLDDLAQDFIETLYMLVGAVYVLESHIEQRWHYISAKVDKNLCVELNRFIVVLVAFVEDSTGLQGVLFFADAQAFIDREVTTLHKVNELRTVFFVAEDLYEV